MIPPIYPFLSKLSLYQPLLFPLELTLWEDWTTDFFKEGLIPTRLLWLFWIPKRLEFLLGAGRKEIWGEGAGEIWLSLAMVEFLTFFILNIRYDIQSIVCSWSWIAIWLLPFLHLMRSTPWRRYFHSFSLDLYSQVIAAHSRSLALCPPHFPFFFLLHFGRRYDIDPFSDFLLHFFLKFLDLFRVNGTARLYGT